MKKNETVKKFSAILLSIVMVLCMMPSMAFAAEADVQTGNVQITVPADAKVFVGTKEKHFKPFIEQETIGEVPAEEGLKTVSYNLPANKDYNFRISGKGYVTYTGKFKSPAASKDPYILNVSESDLKPEGKNAKTVDKASTSNKNYNMADIYLNINPAGYLKLKKNDEYQIVSLRNWEAVDTLTNNYFIEPDYHYEAVNFDGTPSDVVSVSESGKVTAQKEGTAVVLVTYDAFNNISAVGGPFFGAIWPENTGVFVVSVGSSDSTVSVNAKVNTETNATVSNGKLAGDDLDAELDIIYYLTEMTDAAGEKTVYDDAHGSYTFTPTGEVASVEVANPNYAGGKLNYGGFVPAERNADGSYTVKLVEGRNIVKVSDGTACDYQVVSAKGVKAAVTNKTTPGKALVAGDQFAISFDTLYHPVNKLAGIYNMSAAVIYQTVEGMEGKTVGGTAAQYNFAANAKAQTMENQVSITKTMFFGSTNYSLKKGDAAAIPADYTKDTLTVSQGGLFTFGFGSSYGAHREITYEVGASPNFTAVSQTAYFGILPDITLQVEKADAAGNIEVVEVVTQPKKTAYFEGESFDGEGMSLKVTYADGTERTVTGGYSVTPSVMEKDTQKVMVSLGGKIAEVPVTVTPLEVTKIEITKAPSKTAYIAGEYFNPSGMVVSAVYNSGKKEEITDYTYEAAPLTKDVTGVTISYQEKTVEQQITVAEQQISAPEDNKIKVTFTLLGDEKHGEDGVSHTYKKGTIDREWISAMEVTVDKDATVLDVIEKALSIKGMGFSNSTGNYISAINGLAEFDNGPNSGWMYTVNGVYVKNGVAEQVIKDGDVILFHYTDDYTKERASAGWIEPPADDEPGTDIDDPNTPLSPGPEAVKGKVGAMKLTARSERTSKKNVKVTVKADKATETAVKELEEMGYTVKYRYYRSTKKASGYKAALTKKAKTYTNTTGKKGQMYYYKVQLRVYDKDGKLVAKTALKQCRYANRLWTKK